MAVNEITLRVEEEPRIPLKTAEVIEAISPTVDVENRENRTFITVTDIRGTNETELPTNANYDMIANKPRINDVELVGNRTLEDLGIQEESPEISNLEILQIFNDIRRG